MKIIHSFRVDRLGRVYMVLPDSRKWVMVHKAFDYAKGDRMIRVAQKDKIDEVLRYYIDTGVKDVHVVDPELFSVPQLRPHELQLSLSFDDFEDAEPYELAHHRFSMIYHEYDRGFIHGGERTQMIVNLSSNATLDSSDLISHLSNLWEMYAPKDVKYKTKYSQSSGCNGGKH